MRHAIRQSAMVAMVGLAARPVDAMPPPPPPPDVLARIVADCRTPPVETIPLAKATAALPKAPAALGIGWAITLTPPAGAHIGRIIGISQSWSGAIVAATDKGYWIRVPSKQDEAASVPAGPVAVSIRDLPGMPYQMAFDRWTGEPGYVGLNVVLAVHDAPTLLRYQIGGCFPGARPEHDPGAAPTNGIVRLEPAIDRAAVIIRRAPDGHLISVARPPALDNGTTTTSGMVAAASISARIPLASGCDELGFVRTGDTTRVETGCSAEYLRSLAALWARPQRQHRQPLPVTHVRDLGEIDAPIVAVSDARMAMDRPPPDTVKRGDRSDPGHPCALLLAAQTAADAPVTIYGLEARCAHYPRDPSGAPFPPPPAP